jgi:hypothetical protein
MQILTSLSRRRFLTGAAAIAAPGPSRLKAAPANARLNGGPGHLKKPEEPGCMDSGNIESKLHRQDP